MKQCTPLAYENTYNIFIYFFKKKGFQNKTAANAWEDTNTTFPAILEFSYNQLCSSYRVYYRTNINFIGLPLNDTFWMVHHGCVRN